MSSTDLTNLDEPQLVRLAKSGSGGALAELDLRYREALVGFARRSVENDADADDLAQTTLAKAFTRLSRFQAGTSFRTWLFRIARNSIIDWLRSSNRYQSTLEDKRNLEHNQSRNAGGVITAVAGAAESGQTVQESGIFDYAKRVLKPREYQALWWKYVDQLPIIDIAQRMDLSPGAVRVLLTRVRKRLAAFRSEEEHG